MTKELPSAPRLRELFLYDAETGILTWRERPRSDFETYRGFRAWNGRYAGTRAGSDDHKGHREVGVDGASYREHRVIWCLVHNECDSDCLDHIDGDGQNNRLVNLREASVGINSRNQGIGRRNTSGTLGVFWNSQKRRWQAVIGRGIFLGFFERKADAVSARHAAEIEHGYHPNHGRRAA